MTDPEHPNRKLEDIRVGTPAFCRRPFDTRIFKPSQFQEEISAVRIALSDQVEALETKPAHVDITTDDISFRNTFHRWNNIVKGKCLAETEMEALKPKSTLHKERVLRKPLLEFSEKPEPDCSLGVHSVLSASGNALRSRLDIFRKRKRPDESSKNPKVDPEEETIEDVRCCIEKLSEKLHSAREMIAQKNINLTEAPYRRNLFQMFKRIAKHLEECEGRVFEKRASVSDQKRTKPLSDDQKELIRQKIADLEEKVNKMKNCMYFARTDVDSSDIPSELGDDQTEKSYGGARSMDHSPLVSSATMHDDIVIEMQIVHPSFLKTKATDVIALGSHSLQDVVTLCVCSTDDTMQAMHGSLNHKYVLVEGIFYVEEGNNIALQDIEQIISFCEQNKCGWPLDKSRNQYSRFEIAPMSTLLRDIPLRVSNKLLYLYSHRGACEHLLHIKNVRSTHTLDPTSLNFGPAQTKKPRITIRKCSICEKTFASLIVYGGMMNITDPCFYCDTCYYMAYLNKDGNEKMSKTNILQTFPYRGG